MIEGKNLWAAVDLVVRAGNEIDAMETELYKRMTEQLKSEENKLGFKSETGDSDPKNAGADWICVESLSQWGLKKKGNRTTIGNIYVEIVLWTDEGESASCAQIPRVEVGYIGYAKGKIFATYCEAGTSFTQESWERLFPKSAQKYSCWPKSVSPCKGVKWDEDANWVFAVPLFSINCNDDIDRLIIEPAMKLLSGSDPEDALSNVPAIVYAIGKEGELLSTPV